jgi:hypothetical protein
MSPLCTSFDNFVEALKHKMKIYRQDLFLEKNHKSVIMSVNILNVLSWHPTIFRHISTSKQSKWHLMKRVTIGP